MKNRKRIVVAFMLVAVLMLGVGYAALTDNLTITGEATVGATQAQNAFENDIHFSSAVVTSTTGSYTTDSNGQQVQDTATVGQTNNDSANFHANTLARAGQYVVFTFTIINEGTTAYKANITVDDGYPTNTNGDYFLVEQSIGTGVVPVGGTLDVTITVTLKKDPPENLNMAYTLNLTATSVSTTP